MIVSWLLGQGLASCIVVCWRAYFSSASRPLSPLKNFRTVTPLLSRDLTDIPGKEGTMLIVEYAPGGAAPVHRHNAHAFVYVLEGSVVMQLEGGEAGHPSPW